MKPAPNEGSNLAKQRSSDRIEQNLIQAVLNQEYAPGSTLPPERELAEHFGVGRPTVREALQRLERDGWITIRQGQPAIVNDYWRQGNLATLVNIIQNIGGVPDDFITYLLELRLLLTPVYIRHAVAADAPKVVALLSRLEELKDDADSYAAFDWHLQKQLAALCPNPIFLLILNSFDSFYLTMARIYFSTANHRSISRSYYDELLNAALCMEPEQAENVARATMTRSLELWKARNQSNSGG